MLKIIKRKYQEVLETVFFPLLSPILSISAPFTNAIECKRPDHAKAETL